MVEPDEVAQLLKAWAADAASSEHFKRAFSHPELRSHLVHYPESTVPLRGGWRSP
jgi:hypothetical protein